MGDLLLLGPYSDKTQTVHLCLDAGDNKVHLWIHAKYKIAEYVDTWASFCRLNNKTCTQPRESILKVFFLCS